MTNLDPNGQRRILKSILTIVVILLFFPLIPLAVATNFLGTADRFANIPGISRGGGFMSGLVVLILMGTVLAILTAGIIVISDGTGSPLFSDGATPAPGPTPTQTTESLPTSTATPTPTETSLQTTTQTPSDAERRADHEDIETYFREDIRSISEHPNTPPILGTEIRDGELWVVFDETDVHENGSRMRREWATIANGYVNALDEHDGHTTVRMQAFGWNSTGPITTFTVRTEDAEDLLSREIDYDTFYYNYFRTVQATTDEERRIARKIAEHPPDDN